MTKIEYKHFLCDHDQLETRLNELGSESWRLHTCDPVAVVGPYGTGIVQAFVVLDRIVEPEDQEYEPTDSPYASEGIAMKS